MVTEKTRNTEHFEPVRKGDFRQDRTKLPETPETVASQVFEEQMGRRQAHSAGVLQAVSGYFKQKKSSRGQVKRENSLFDVKTRQNA
jgi:hypothetical protein